MARPRLSVRACASVPADRGRRLRAHRARRRTARSAAPQRAAQCLISCGCVRLHGCPRTCAPCRATRRAQPLRCAVPCDRRAREPHGRAWPAGSRRTARAEAQVPCHLCETALRPKALRSHLRACAAKWCAPPNCSRCPPHRAAADLSPVVFADPFSTVLSTLGVGRLPCRTFRLRCAQSARLRRSCPQWPIRCTERMGLSSRQVAVGARDRCRRRVRHAVLAGTCLRRLQPCARERAARPDLFGCALTRLCIAAVLGGSSRNLQPAAVHVPALPHGCAAAPLFAPSQRMRTRKARRCLPPCTPPARPLDSLAALTPARRPSRWVGALLPIAAAARVDEAAADAALKLKVAVCFVCGSTVCAARLRRHGARCWPAAGLVECAAWLWIET